MKRVILAVLLLLIGLPSAVESADAAPLWPIEAELLKLTNAERRRYKLPPLSIDAGLLKSTRRHCYWMARARSLEHTGAQVAENIAMGQRTSREAVRSWMNSSGHRANLLHPRYRRIGVAAYHNAGGATYWCVQFLR